MTLAPARPETSADAPPARFKGSRSLVAVAALALVGFGVRIWLSAGQLGALNSDEAIPALMGKWLLRGDIRIFHYGNDNYGGGLIALPFGISQEIFGTNRFALAVPILLLDIVAALLVWRIGTRFLTPRQAALAALAFWLGPAIFVSWGVRAQTFYMLTLVLGLAVMCCAQRAVEERTRWRDWALVGVFAGLGWWESPNIMYFVVPTVIWLLVAKRAPAAQVPCAAASKAIEVNLRQLFPRALMAIPGAIVGAAPWIVFNIVHPLASFPDHPEWAEGNYFDHLHYFFVYGLPYALGLRGTFVGEWIIGPGHTLIYGVVLAAVVFAVVKGLRSRSLGAIALLAFPLLFAVIPFASSLVLGDKLGNGRYLFFLAPIVPLAIAPLARRTAGLVVIALALAATNVYGYVKLDERAGDRWYVSVPPMEQLIERLDQLGVTAGDAPFWIAYKLTWETDERITVIPNDFGTTYPPYLEAVREERRPVRIAEASANVDDYIQFNAGQGIPMRKVRAGAYVIIIPTTDAKPAPPVLNGPELRQQDEPG